MALPARDRRDLDLLGVTYTEQVDGDVLAVRISDYSLPPGLSAQTVEVMFRLPSGYPDTAPDMWWVLPALTNASGGVIEATQVTEHHFGLNWQRWSRHLPPGAWRPGVDSLKSFIKLLDAELNRAAVVAA
jgi:Prokaryotic E2 family E